MNRDEGISAYEFVYSYKYAHSGLGVFDNGGKRTSF